MKEEIVEKDKWIHVRVTESELNEIKSQMELYGYHCRSKFIRAKLLNKRIRVNRNVVLTDSAIRNKINGLSNLIGRIGADYNQATKRFNSLVKQKREDGSPVINARAANYYLRKLSAMTTELRDLMRTVIETVENIELKNSEESENC